MSTHPTFNEYDGVWEYINTTHPEEPVRLCTIIGSEGQREDPDDWDSMPTLDVTFDVLWVTPFVSKFTGRLTYEYGGVPVTSLRRPNVDAIWAERDRVETEIIDLEVEVARVQAKLEERRATRTTLEQLENQTVAREEGFVEP